MPLLEIDVHHEISGAAFEKVRDGELDVAFYYGNLVHPAVASLPLRELAFRIVVPAAWAGRLANADWERNRRRAVADDAANQHPSRACH